MDVSLRRAGEDERETVRVLLAAYLYEFDGRIEPYPYFDAYWSEPERVPLLIDVDGEVAGFCLVRIRDDDGWSIAEFTVVPQHRRHGVGRLAVDALADAARLQGATYLEAKVHPGNDRAARFWTGIGFQPVATDPVLVTRRVL